MRRILVCILLSLASASSVADTAIDLEQYDGKVVLVDFWASWCVPCRRSFPWMNKMQSKYGDDGLVIVAVNLDNNIVDAAEFLKTYPSNFRIVYDTDKMLARKYEVQAMPSSFLIGRDGQIIDSHMGFKVKQEPEYEAAIARALRQTQVVTQ